MYRQDNFIPLIKIKLITQHPISLQSKVKASMYGGKGSNIFIWWFCRLDKNKQYHQILGDIISKLWAWNTILVFQITIFLYQKLSNSVHNLQNQINGTKYIPSVNRCSHYITERLWPSLSLNHKIIFKLFDKNNWF